MPAATPPQVSSTGAPLSDADKAARVRADAGRLDAADRTLADANAKATAAGVPGFTNLPPGAAPNYNVPITPGQAPPTDGAATQPGANNPADRQGQLIAAQKAAQDANTARDGTRADVAGNVAQELNEVGSQRIFSRVSDFDKAGQQLVGWAGKEPGAQQYADIVGQVKNTVVAQRPTQQSLQQQSQDLVDSNARVADAQKNLASVSAAPVEQGPQATKLHGQDVMQAQEQLNAANKDQADKKDAITVATQAEFLRLNNADPARTDALSSQLAELDRRIPSLRKTPGVDEAIGAGYAGAIAASQVPGTRQVVVDNNRLGNVQLQADAARAVVGRPDGATPAQTGAVTAARNDLTGEVQRQMASAKAAADPNNPVDQDNRSNAYGIGVTTLVPGQAVADASGAAYHAVMIQPSVDRINQAYANPGRFRQPGDPQTLTGMQAASRAMAEETGKYRGYAPAMIVQGVLPTLGRIGGDIAATSPKPEAPRYGAKGFERAPQPQSPAESAIAPTLGSLSAASDNAAWTSDGGDAVGGAAGDMAHALLAGGMPASPGVVAGLRSAIGTGQGATLSTALASATQATDPGGSNGIVSAINGGIKDLDARNTALLQRYQDTVGSVVQGRQALESLLDLRDPAQKAKADSATQAFLKSPAPGSKPDHPVTIEDEINQLGGEFDRAGRVSFRAGDALGRLARDPGTRQTPILATAVGTNSTAMQSAGTETALAESQSAQKDAVDRIERDNGRLDPDKQSSTFESSLGNSLRVGVKEPAFNFFGNLTASVGSEPSFVELTGSQGADRMMNWAADPNSSRWNPVENPLKWNDRVNTVQPHQTNLINALGIQDAAARDWGKLGRTRLDFRRLSAPGLGLNIVGATLLAGSSIGTAATVSSDSEHPDFDRVRAGYYAAGAGKEFAEGVASLQARRYVRAVNDVVLPRAQQIASARTGMPTESVTLGDIQQARAAATNAGEMPGSLNRFAQTMMSRPYIKDPAATAVEFKNLAMQPAQFYMTRGLQGVGIALDGIGAVDQFKAGDPVSGSLYGASAAANTAALAGAWEIGAATTAWVPPAAAAVLLAGGLNTAWSFYRNSKRFEATDAQMLKGAGLGFSDQTADALSANNVSSESGLPALAAAADNAHVSRTDLVNRLRTADPDKVEALTHYAASVPRDSANRFAATPTSSPELMNDMNHQLVGFTHGVYGGASIPHEDDEMSSLQGLTDLARAIGVF